MMSLNAKGGGSVGGRGRGRGRGRVRGNRGGARVQSKGKSVEIFIGDVGCISKKEFENNIKKSGAGNGLSYVTKWDSKMVHGFATYHNNDYAVKAVIVLSKTYKNVNLSHRKKNVSKNKSKNSSNMDDEKYDSSEFNWFFQNDNNKIEKCEEWLSKKLRCAKANQTIPYKVGQWNYTTVKYGNGKATQTNDVTKKVRYIVLQKSNKNELNPPIAPKPTLSQYNKQKKFNKNEKNNQFNNNNKTVSKQVYLDQESKRIEGLFRATMNEAQFIIVGIERIKDLNQTQWDCYQNISKNTKNTGKKSLFHGTSHDIINKIKINGFNRDFNKASAYGKGTYFARDASYSHGYCVADASGEYRMLFCKVIVGDYCIGNGSMATPPCKADGRTQYDCLVNDIQNPSIFVISRDYHCIPSWLIKYKRV